MYLWHIFYSFVPLRNPIGFGAADLLSFTAVALLVLCVFAWPILEPSIARVAANPRWSLLLIATLPILLRVVLLPRYPAQQPILLVLLPAPAFCVLCYWMLRGWLSPAAALTGGLLCISKFGPLSPWMNTDADGVLLAMGACVVLGLFPRLFSIRFKTVPRLAFAVRILVLLCVAQFLFWYALYLCAPDVIVTAMSQYETWP